jgi:hypothetical protein
VRCPDSQILTTNEGVGSEKKQRNSLVGHQGPRDRSENKRQHLAMSSNKHPYQQTIRQEICLQGRAQSA